MKNYIVLHFIEYLNYTGVLTNNVMLLSLPNAPCKIVLNYLYQFYHRLKPVFKVIVKLANVEAL